MPLAKRLSSKCRTIFHCSLEHYLVSKPPRVAGILEDNDRGCEIVRKSMGDGYLIGRGIRSDTRRPICTT